MEQLFENSLSLQLSEKEAVWICTEDLKIGTFNLNLLNVSDSDASVFLFALNERGEIVGMTRKLEPPGCHYGVLHYGNTCITVYCNWGSKSSETLVPRSDPSKTDPIRSMKHVCFQFWYEINALLAQVYPEEKVPLTWINKPFGLAHAKFAIQLFTLFHQSRQGSNVSIVSRSIDQFVSFARQDYPKEYQHLEKAIGSWREFPVDHVEFQPFEKLFFFVMSDKQCNIDYRIFPPQYDDPFHKLKTQDLESKINQTCSSLQGTNSFERIQMEKLDRLELTIQDLKTLRQIHLECFRDNPHAQTILKDFSIQSGFEWTNPFFIDSFMKDKDRSVVLENEWRMLEDIDKGTFAKTEAGTGCLLFIRPKEKKLFQSNKRIFSIGLLLTLPTHSRFMHLCLGDPIVYCYKPNQGLLWIPFDQIDYLSDLSPTDT